MTRVVRRFGNVPIWLLLVILISQRSKMTRKIGHGRRFAALGAGAAPDQSARVSFREKILALDALPAWREAMRRSGRRVVATNGCFDLLHVGHATYLETARRLGDVLLVGVNCDASVRALKGPSRPVNAELDRALLVAALASVDAVCVFPEASAAEFLRAAQPEVWAKGGDYTLDTLNQTERQVVETAGGRIAFIPWVPGKSTTALLQRFGGG